MDLDDLRRLCVDGFPTSTNRKSLADAFEEVVDSAAECALSYEIWVDGSFLTSKLDPADVDAVFVFNPGAVAEAEYDAQALVQQIGKNLRDETGCDTYVVLAFPAGHPLHQEAVRRLQHWLAQFGYDRSGSPRALRRSA
jgi:hypothetical protein